MSKSVRSGAARALVLALGLASVAGAALAAGAPTVIGVNAAILNTVRIRSVGDAQARAAVLRQRVALADEVQTGGRSQLQMLLLDRSMFTVGANARLTIDRFVYDPARGAKSMSASVVKGAFRFMSGKPDARGQSSINTPVATIGIRGTILEGVVGPDAAAIAAGEPGVGRNVRSDPATASLIILRGPGRRTQGGAVPGLIDVSAAGRTVSIGEPLGAVYVPRPGAAPIGPFRISAEGLRQVQALIFPGVAQALGLPTPGAGQAFVPYGDGAPPRPDRPFPPGYDRPGPYRPGFDQRPDPRGQGPGWDAPQFPFPNGGGVNDGGQRAAGGQAPAVTRAAPAGQNANGAGQSPNAVGQRTNAAPTPAPSPTPTGSPGPNRYGKKP